MSAMDGSCMGPGDESAPGMTVTDDFVYNA
jgi:hypothetical protein